MTQHLWSYRAETDGGEIVEGEVEAEDVSVARNRLRATRLAPLSIQLVRRRAWYAGHRRNALSDFELARLSARLRDILTAGIPLASALRLAVDQSESPRERSWTQTALQSIAGGKSLSEAIEENAIATSFLFRALVKTGETLGAIGPAMVRLADHYERRVKLRRELAAQLFYPGALVVLILLTLVFLSFFILPQFEGIFAAADAEPPPETRLVLGLGAVIREGWPALIAMTAVTLLLGPLVLRRHRRLFERIRLGLPVVGTISRYSAFGAYFRTLAALVGGGAPLASSMPLARDAVSVSSIRLELVATEDLVRSGERLADALRRQSSCPAELFHFIEIGEETGILGKLAAEAAGRAESKVAATLARAMALLAPGLTALMGLLTAGVIAAVMSGVLSLNEAVY